MKVFPTRAKVQNVAEMAMVSAGEAKTQGE